MFPITLVFFLHLHQIFVVQFEEMGIVVTASPYTVVFHPVSSVRMVSLGCT